MFSRRGTSEGKGREGSEGTRCGDSGISVGKGGEEGDIF